jgi:hypothetical protein
MLKKIAVLAAALWLTGCGIPEYFDQHPANVREASADDSDTVAPKRNTPVAQTPLPTVVQLETPAPVASSPVVAPVPAQPPATSRQESPSPTSPPSNAYVAPPQPAAAAEESPTAVPPPPIVTQAPAQPSGPVPQSETAQSPPPVDVPVATSPPQEAAPQEAPPEQPVSQDSPAATVSSARPTIHSYCESLAVQRAADAAANGYDDDTQQAVHDGSYKKCVIWETAHGGPN